MANRWTDHDFWKMGMQYFASVFENQEAAMNRYRADLRKAYEAGRRFAEEEAEDNGP